MSSYHDGYMNFFLEPTKLDECVFLLVKQRNTRLCSCGVITMQQDKKRKSQKQHRWIELRHQHAPNSKFVSGEKTSRMIKNTRIVLNVKAHIFRKQTRVQDYNKRKTIPAAKSKNYLHFSIKNEKKHFAGWVHQENVYGIPPRRQEKVSL